MALGMGRKAICVSRAYRDCALFCSLRADHEQTRTASTPNQRLMAASCMMTTHAACTQAMRQSNTQTSRRESSLGRCQANARPLPCPSQLKHALQKPNMPSPTRGLTGKSGKSGKPSNQPPKIQIICLMLTNEIAHRMHSRLPSRHQARLPAALFCCLKK